MVTRDDVALVLSNSGETRELADIVAHTRRFAIPLIGVASRPGSTLLKAADIALELPQAPEACSVGLAPTTSTTLTMALGDALRSQAGLEEEADLRTRDGIVVRVADAAGDGMERGRVCDPELEQSALALPARDDVKPQGSSLPGANEVDRAADGFPDEVPELR